MLPVRREIYAEFTARCTGRRYGFGTRRPSPEPFIPLFTHDLLLALLALLAIFIPLLLAGAVVLLPDLLKKRRKLARQSGRVTPS